jgi:hypothetical protein
MHHCSIAKKAIGVFDLRDVLRCPFGWRQGRINMHGIDINQRRAFFFCQR